MTLLALESVSQTMWRGERPIAVLKDVSLVVAEGEFVSIWAPSRGGKTTLLKIAAGLLPPSSGRVLFAGRDLASSANPTGGYAATDIGWVGPSATPVLPDIPAAVHIALPLYREWGADDARRLALRALGRVGGLDCAEQIMAQLSDTDRVLVSIAAALVHGPRLLVIDDPTSGFSLTDQAQVLGLLRRLADKGTAVVMAVPEMAAMLPAHARYTIHNGRLVGGNRVAGSENVVRLRRESSD